MSFSSDINKINEFFTENQSSLELFDNYNLTDLNKSLSNLTIKIKGTSPRIIHKEIAKKRRSGEICGREQQKFYAKHASDTLSDGYIKNLIKGRLSGDDRNIEIPPELIKLKRENLRIKRLIRSIHDEQRSRA